ncbi:Nuclear protein 1 [Labeo rohita]|uniref:Nuclear protein 1 n=1 Tax=Labeo rohita TaxID=84645 RepID=A0ABQ8MRR1_LABRO|nr:Nuclear protein 1 [Labeo rohita]
MATDIDRLVSFEEAHYDEYEYYNLEEYSCHAGGKGRTKKEIGLNTNRHCPAGHERKIAGKLQNNSGRTYWRWMSETGSWSKCLFCLFPDPLNVDVEDARRRSARARARTPVPHSAAAAVT